MAAASSKMEVQLNLLWAQYERGLAEAERATQQRTSRMGAIFDKAGKSYGKAITKSIVGMFGIGLADDLTKGIIESLKNPMFESAGANIAYAVGEGFTKAMKNVPIAGALGQVLGDAVGDFFDPGSSSIEQRIADSRLVAAKRGDGLQGFGRSLKDLEYQRSLVEAVNDDERVRLQRQHEISRVLTEANKKLIEQGFSVAETRDLVQQMEDAYKRLYAAQDAQQERLERDKYWETFWEDYFDGIESAADYWDDLMSTISNGVEREIQSAAREREKLLEDVMDERGRIQGASNISSIGTAVGGVRVAGAIDYSSERMATNLERIRDIDAKIEDNTRYLRELRAI